jgi:quercetin dioxygenase-like cupin family protein
MKSFGPLLFLFLFSTVLYCQPLDIYRLDPPDTFSNIYVKKISGDSLVSCFVIWIKKEVPAHYHEYHSEHICLLEGEGRMTLGDSVFVIRPGDWVFIPKGVVHAFTCTSSLPAKVVSLQAPSFDGSDRRMPPKKD